MAAKHLSLHYLYAGSVGYTAGDALAQRTLADLEFVSIRRGCPTYYFGDRSVMLKPGSVVLGRPGVSESYEWDSQGPTQHSYFHFQIDQLPDYLKGPIHEWPHCLVEPPAVIPALLESIVDYCIRHTANHAAQQPEPSVVNDVETLLNLYLRADKKPAITRFSQAVENALTLMRSSLENRSGSGLTLSHFAQASHVSEKHLCRLFAKELGISPIQTYRRMQMQFGLILLARTSSPMKGIARQLGIDDPLYFSRLFQKHFDCSPTQMRHHLQNGGRPPPNALPAGVSPVSFTY